MDTTQLTFLNPNTTLAFSNSTFFFLLLMFLFYTQYVIIIHTYIPTSFNTRASIVLIICLLPKYFCFAHYHIKYHIHNHTHNPVGTKNHTLPHLCFSVLWWCLFTYRSIICLFLEISVPVFTYPHIKSNSCFFFLSR